MHQVLVRNVHLRHSWQAGLSTFPIFVGTPNETPAARRRRREVLPLRTLRASHLRSGIPDYRAPIIICDKQTERASAEWGRFSFNLVRVRNSKVRVRNSKTLIMGEAKTNRKNKDHLGLYDTTYRPLISESKPVCCITLEPVSLTLRRSVLGSRVSDTKLVPGDTGYACTNQPYSSDWLPS